MSSKDSVKELLAAESKAKDEIHRALQKREEILGESRAKIEKKIKKLRDGMKQRLDEERTVVNKHIAEDVKKMEAKMTKEIEDFKAIASKKHKDIVNLLVNAAITV